ncbi:MAG: hypothetical protein AAF604_10020 [Acidobacteriota bacterium]
MLPSRSPGDHLPKLHRRAFPTLTPWLAAPPADFRARLKRLSAALRKPAAGADLNAVAGITVDALDELYGLRASQSLAGLR